MPSDKKPILAIDVDGVIIPRFQFTVDEFHKDTHTLFFYDRAGEGWVKMRADFPEIFQRLREHFELWWGTGWEEEANDFLLEPLGFEDPLPWIPLKRPLSGALLTKVPREYYWKTPWIIQWAEEVRRPFALIDDLISPGDIEWAAERTAEGIPTLLVQTDDVIGWTDDHETQLVEWAKGVMSDAGSSAKT